MTDSNSFEWFDIQADSDQWNSYVRQTGQSVFHNSSVLEAHRFGKDQAIGILVRRSGRVVLVFGGLIGKTEGQTSFSTLSFLASERSKDTLVDPLVEWISAQSISVITLGSYGGGVEACKFAQDQYQRTVRLEFIYDLTVSEEQRFARLANNHRRQLKGLESDAVRLIEIKNHPALVLTKLRQEWRSRKGWERSWLGVAKSYLYHDYLLRTLQRGECGKLYGLQDGNGVLLTVALMLEDAREAFYMIGANSAEGYKAGASFRTFWELCRVYQDRGLERLNFGGVPLEAEHDGHEEHGVFRFKKGFGIEPTRRISLVCACPAHNQLGFQDGSR